MARRDLERTCLRIPALPENTREGCLVGVWSTPGNPENHARRLTREIDLCPHRDEPGEPEEDDES
jgi:hypothetical protein